MLAKYLLPMLRPLQNSVSKVPASCAYCTSMDMTQLSSVHRGLQFENRSMALLERHLSMSLKRIGGKGDGGVDMLGWWWIPHGLQDASQVDQRRRIRVIGQCKAEKKKIGPKYIRELEGVLQRYHTSSLLGGSQYIHDTPSKDLSVNMHQHVPSLGLFISESPYTNATILYAQSSSIPLLLLYLPPEDGDLTLSTRNDILCTAIWNPALAGDQGLLKGQMEIRWERSIRGPDRPALWWQNAKLPNYTPDVMSNGRV